MRVTVLISLFSAALATLGQDALAQSAGIDDVSWIQGCWAAEDRDAGSGELWIRTDDGSLIGAGRTVRDGVTQSYEFLEITVRDGVLVYLAEPNCQDETVFPVARVGADEIVFENPSHDFPQRIGYRRLGPDRLLARVEGETGEGVRAIDFPLRREDCAVLGAMPQPASDQ